MHHRRTDGRIVRWLFVTVLSWVPASSGTAMAGEDAERSALIGTPTRVVIGPESPPLRGRRATRQLIVTGAYADGSVRDLTRALTWTSLDPAIAAVSPRGQVVPRGNGAATIVASHGSVEVRATVQVERMDQPSVGEFSTRRHSRVQSGRVQHRRLSWHAHRQGGLSPQPARLPAGPGFLDPEP